MKLTIPPPAWTRRPVERAPDGAAQTRDHPGADERDEVDVHRDARFEPHGGTGRDVEAATVCLLAIEHERRVGFGEVVVRTDLDGPVAAVLDAQGVHGPSRIDLDRLVGPDDLAGDQRLPDVHCVAGADRIVQGDELGSVGEGRFDLHLGQHLRDTLHHVVARQHVSAVLHQIGNTAPVAQDSSTHDVSTATASG